MIVNSECFPKAVALFDASNALDPNLDEGQPKELLYAYRMSDMLRRFAPEADEVAQLAARAQHIQRWMVPRKNYPLSKAGYFAWRTSLYRLHAKTAGDIMRRVGYDDAIIEQVKLAISKQAIKTDPNSQLLEDISCLVFIESYMLGFIGQHAEYSEGKWLDIINKTWKKMSVAAHTFTTNGGIEIPESLLPIMSQVVSGR